MGVVEPFLKLMGTLTLLLVIQKLTWAEMMPWWAVTMPLTLAVMAVAVMWAMEIAAVVRRMADSDKN